MVLKFQVQIHFIYIIGYNKENKKTLRPFNLIQTPTKSGQTAKNSQAQQANCTPQGTQDYPQAIGEARPPITLLRPSGHIDELEQHRMTTSENHSQPATDRLAQPRAHK